MDFINFYQRSILFFLYEIFILLIIFLFLNIKSITSKFREIKRKTWIYLLIIFLAGFFLRVFIFPHFHIMYVDEPWYLEVAKNMNQKLKPVICQYTDYDLETCRHVLKPPALPFLISIVFLIFGPSNYVALYFSSLLGSLSIILIFLLTHLLFKNQNISLWSSFFLALTPLYILWSNSVETNNASVFFVLLTMMFFIIYTKSREKSIFILTSLSLIFTILIRFENVLLVIIFFLAYLKLSKLPTNKFYSFLNSLFPSIVIIILIIIIIIEPFFLSFILPSLPKYFIDYHHLNFFLLLKEVSFNYIYLLLITLGLFFRDKKDTNTITYLIISFLFFFFFYLPIFSQSRMALTPGIFMIILSAYSLEKLLSLFKKHYSIARVVIILLLLFIFGLSLNSAYEQTNFRYNKKILEVESIVQIKEEIPENCYVISELPTVLSSVSNLRVIGTDTALNNPQVIENIIKKENCMYYFYDGYCTEFPISPNQDSIKKCHIMLQTFDNSKEQTFQRKIKWKKSEYFLFRINGLRN